jgi:hypothetical protein
MKSMNTNVEFMTVKYVIHIYRMDRKSLDKNAFKSQLLVSNDLWPTLYKDYYRALKD